MTEPMVLRDYQRVGYEQLIRTEAALLADDLGLGKTLVATETIRAHRARRVLIICPITPQASWIKTLKRQFPSLRDSNLIQVVGTYSKDSNGWKAMASGQPGVFIIGWEAMRGAGTSSKTAYYLGENPKTKTKGFDIREAWKKIPTWEYVIADEVHRACNPKTNTYKALKSIESARRLGLSATPGGSAPQGLFGPIAWLWPKRYPSFWRWATNYLELEIQYVSGRTVKKFTHEKWPGATFNGLPNVVRRMQSDVFDELPDVTTTYIDVPMTKQQTKIYNQFLQDCMGFVGEELVVASLPVEQRTRLRTIAAAEPTEVVRKLDENGNASTRLVIGPNAHAAKLEALEELLSDLPPDEPVLCFTHSSQLVDLVVHRLPSKYRAVGWTGSISKPRRAEIMETFGTKDGPRVLVCNIAAIGEGTDGLQRVCRNEVWLSQEDRNVLNIQALGRLNRMGQTNGKINRWYLISPGTIDETVYERTEERTAEMDIFYKGNKHG